MTTQTQTIPAAAARRRPRTVAVISGQAHPHAVHQLLGAVDHDVILIESTAHAYAQIKRVAPDLVIVCLSGEDEDGCQLLSMLSLDQVTSRIPLVTHITAPSFGAAETAESAEDVFRGFVPGYLN